MDVGEYFSLHPTTTHSAVAYLDRLHLSGFSRHEWQMLAISCILIAGTYSTYFYLTCIEIEIIVMIILSRPSIQLTVSSSLLSRIAIHLLLDMSFSPYTCTSILKNIYNMTHKKLKLSFSSLMSLHIIAIRSKI